MKGQIGTAQHIAYYRDRLFFSRISTFYELLNSKYLYIYTSCSAPLRSVGRLRRHGSPLSKAPAAPITFPRRLRRIPGAFGAYMALRAFKIVASRLCFFWAHRIHHGSPMRKAPAAPITFARRLRRTTGAFGANNRRLRRVVGASRLQ